MAKARKYKIEKNYVEIPNKTAQAVQATAGDDTISLQALGLIVNLWSYNVDEWELHKTELYKRYGKNKESSVSNAWKELVKNKYIIEYKYRVGKAWEYIYVYNIQPFTDEQIREIWTEATEEHGKLYTLQNKIWGLDFQDPKMRTSNCGPQNQEVSNILLKKDSIKERYNKRNLSIKEEEKKKEPKTKTDRLIDPSIKNEIHNLNIPDLLKNTLLKYGSLLEQHNVPLQEIETLYSEYKDHLNDIEINQVLHRVCTAKNIEKSFVGYLRKALTKDYTKKSATQGANSAPQGVDITPEWYKQGKHKEKPQGTPEEVPYEEMSEEQRKVADLLKQYTEGAQ